MLKFILQQLFLIQFENVYILIIAIKAKKTRLIFFSKVFKK